MTIDEAVFTMEHYKLHFALTHKAVEAFDMAIKALEQEPCEDCISRQQAIDKMKELEEEDIEAYGCSIPEGFDGKRAIEALKALSSVHPKPKMGHWVKVIEENGHAFYLCSVCKEGTDENYDWCPFCGCKM